MIGELMPYPAYKGSGVSWLDDVPDRWDVQRLRNIAEMRVSNVDKNTSDQESPIRLCNYVDVYKNDRIRERMSFMRATATSDEIDRFRLVPGDVLVTKDSEMWNDIGVPALVETSAEDLICGYHLALLRPIERRLLGSYLFRAFQSSGVRYQLHVEANGVTRYGLSQGAIKSVWIPIPSLPEQAAIVKYLDYIDQRIRRYVRTKQQMLRLLGEQKQALVHHFVMRGLDASVRLKPSGSLWLGDIPEHWFVSRSKRLFSVRKDLARPDDVQLSATQAYGVIPQAEFEAKVGRRVVKISMHLEKRRHVEKDDFVISMRSFQGGLERAWASGAIRSSYVVLQPGPSVDVDFFSYLLKSPDYIRALQGTADFIRDGQDLTFDNFCRVDLPVIPLEEQKAIATAITKAASGISSNIAKLTSELDLIREYRNRLIDDVAIGRLDVRDVAARLPDDLVEEEMVPEELEPALGEELESGDPQREARLEEVEA
jgi:type I restriction enzyme S subunit